MKLPGREGASYAAESSTTQQVVKASRTRKVVAARDSAGELADVKMIKDRFIVMGGKLLLSMLRIQLTSGDLWQGPLAM